MIHLKVNHYRFAPVACTREHWRQEARQATVAFVLDARSTGKATLLRQQFESRAIIKLLRSCFEHLAELGSCLRLMTAVI